MLSDLPQASLVAPLRQIITDLSSKSVTVGQLKGKHERVTYIKSLGTRLPDLTKRTGTPVPLDRLAATANAKASAKSTSATASKSLIDRKALIPSQAQSALNINDHKLQQMCRELRKLPLDTYPVAIAASFRVFLELSLDHYASEKKVAGYNADTMTLKPKLEAVASHLQATGVNKRDLQAFRALASNPNRALSIDRLHGVIHSRYELPTAAELRTGWSEVQVAFTKIWA